MVAFVIYLALTVPILLYTEQILTYLKSILRLQTHRSRRLRWQRWQRTLDSEASSESSTTMSEVKINDNDDEYAIGIDDDEDIEG